MFYSNPLQGNAVEHSFFKILITKICKPHYVYSLNRNPDSANLTELNDFINLLNSSSNFTGGPIEFE